MQPSFLLFAIASFSLVVLEAPAGTVAHPYSDPDTRFPHLTRRGTDKKVDKVDKIDDAGFFNGGTGNGEVAPPPRKKPAAPEKGSTDTGADKSDESPAQKPSRPASKASAKTHSGGRGLEWGHQVEEH